MAIKAIFYDLDGTLRVNQPIGWRVFSDYALELGVQVTEKSRLESARWTHSYFAESPELYADRLAHLDEKSFWIQFSLRQLLVLGAAQKQAEELAPVMHHYMQTVYRPVDVIMPDLVETLQELKSQGYILGVMSNRDEPYVEYLGTLNLSEFFFIVMHAGEAGVYKPNPGVFDYMLKKAGVSAADSMYVGDNYYADVVGARNAGLAPVLLDYDGIFADADCPVIKSHRQLLSVLKFSC